MPLAPDLASSREANPDPEARRTLVGTGINHALHDGYTDLIYVLLPVWQGELGLGFAALALLRSLYNGALAALQMPSSHLARRLGARTVLVLGTLLSAGGYALAGASGGLVGLCVALVLGGAEAARSTRWPPRWSPAPTAHPPAARSAPTISPETWGRRPCHPSSAFS